MKFSRDAKSATQAEELAELSRDDLPDGFAGVVDDGWFVSDGAVLLRAFLGSYHGDRARFKDVTGYEIAVNGRGIPDLDVDAVGPERTRILLRRGLAFAMDALHLAGRTLPDVRLVGYVSVAPTLMDPDDLTGNVTFCSRRGVDEPYADVENLNRGIMISVDSTECADPLPVR